ncbi:uncharacterized protein LOC120349649 [Nilaparvata lugens]|uniref:uncharacterized protein LOC120349649 n=1 Tax=Nilaparvata lugens TaxID=108931 RepID=UPI00193E2483|nr:uncharacterized protein LOC120349649 [Nilaparvata lugens]
MGPIPSISEEEVRVALHEMATNKAVGPDEIPVEVWKMLNDTGVKFITGVFNAVLSEGIQMNGGEATLFSLSPLLFNLVMDYLTREIQHPPPWDILYADDIVLIRKTPEELQQSLDLWRNSLEAAGLRISREKTVYMHCSFGDNDDQAQAHIQLQGTPLPIVTQCKYLGSIISHDGSIDADISSRINTGWIKWRELTGVLCDKRMPVPIKGKVYKAAVRPAMLYGSECWPLKKQQEDRLHSAEMKMLRWAGGVTRLDHIRNTHVRGSFRVAPVYEKIMEGRLRWYGHVNRRSPNHMTRKVLDMETQPRGRGRPRLTWLGLVHRKYEAVGPDKSDDPGSFELETEIKESRPQIMGKRFLSAWAE